MHKHGVVAAVLALALAACGDMAGGPMIPPTPEGAQAPAKIENAPAAEGAARLSREERQQWENRVREYLTAAHNNYAQNWPAAEGIEEQMIGMQAASDFRWYVDLTADVTYRFIGACDDDCTDMDFELIAPEGGVVATDRGNNRDDFPVATFRPAQSGRYIARLLMMECRVTPCFAGMRVFTEPAPD